MPGIAGILKKQISNDAAHQLKAMLQSMMHETFYTQAAYTEQKLAWYVGSVAIRGSFADCMPFYNETRDVLLFLVGECFTDLQIITMLRSKGHEVNASNASYLVHLYEEEGPDFVKKLNGWFSGVVLDTRRGKAVLFNDRYGMQRIYYYEDACGFYFSSEAKALLKAIPALRAIEMQSVAEYICFDCVLNNQSYFPHVHLLPGGSTWIFDRGIADRRCYFNPIQLENQSRLGLQQFSEELIETFRNLLPRYLMGETVGISVTGGLDTRLIMACLPYDSRQIKTFTFGGMYRDSMDVRLGRKVSRACSLEHHTLRLDKKFLSDYHRHAARAIYVTDGLADATNVDEVYLNNLARNVAPIKLTGNFGSQVLGRVRRALRNRFLDPRLINPEFRNHLVEVSETIVPFAQEHDLSYLLNKEIPWYWARFTISGMSQLMVRSPYLDNDFVDLLYRAPHEGFDGDTFELESIAKNNRELLAIRTNRGIGGKAPPLISTAMKMLYKTRRLADKTFNSEVLPHSLHHIVSRIDSLILSPLHVNKVFLGFEDFRHYNMWFRRELASYLKEMLLDNRTLGRPYWNAKHLVRIVNDHVNGRGRYLSEIRKVLTIELIHRVLVEDGG